MGSTKEQAHLDSRIEVDDLPPEGRAAAPAASAPMADEILTLAEVERWHIVATLERFGANRKAPPRPFASAKTRCSVA